MILNNGKADCKHKFVQNTIIQDGKKEVWKVCLKCDRLEVESEGYNIYGR